MRHFLPRKSGKSKNRDLNFGVIYPVFTRAIFSKWSNFHDICKPEESGGGAGTLHQPVDDLRLKVLDDYLAWRCANVTKGTGHRTADLERNTLINALHWAARQETIQSNPIRDRQRYHSSTFGRHCHSMAPSSIDELHNVPFTRS